MREPPMPLLIAVAVAGLVGTLAGGAIVQTKFAPAAMSGQKLFEAAHALSPAEVERRERAWDTPVTRWDRVAIGAPPRVLGRLNGDSRPFFEMPLRSWYAVTDRFGVQRGPDSFHGGIDLGLPDGAAVPVYASCSGKIAVAEQSQTYGNHVVVDCGSDFTTVYAHFSEILVRPGQAVSQNTVLGRSGSTGFSTGEHLHFEIRWKGFTVDPERYLEFRP